MAIKHKPLTTSELVEIYENLKGIKKLNSDRSYNKRHYYGSVNTDKLQKQIVELKTTILARLEM